LRRVSWYTKTSAAASKTCSSTFPKSTLFLTTRLPINLKTTLIATVSVKTNLIIFHKLEKEYPLTVSFGGNVGDCVKY